VLFDLIRIFLILLTQANHLFRMRFLKFNLSPVIFEAIGANSLHTNFGNILHTNWKNFPIIYIFSGFQACKFRWVALIKISGSFSFLRYTKHIFFLFGVQNFFLVYWVEPASLDSPHTKFRLFYTITVLNILFFWKIFRFIWLI
jgi:hypothetical protein